MTKLDLDKKISGVLVPVFAIRTEDDLGVGDTEGMKQMIDWCAVHGFAILQLLPVHESSCAYNPYNTVSAFALEPAFIATTPQQLPDLPPRAFEDIRQTDTLAALRHGPVQYARVKTLKLRLLKAAFQQFQHRRETREVTAFDGFVRANDAWLDSYSLFSVLMEENNGCDDWESWPTAQRDHSSALSWLTEQPSRRIAEVQEQMQFFAYVQWIAWRQWQEVRRHAESRGVCLMGDVPFGISRSSADVWANRELFDLDWSCGAPPEPSFQQNLFTQKWGQNWGFPMYRWEEFRKRKFAWWRARAQQASQLFHLFRLDHVLGFYRVYAFPWMPKDNAKFEALSLEEARQKTNGLLPRFWPNADDTAKHKKLNRAQGDEILRMLRAAAGDATIIAEDLGLVPDYVRPHLEQLGIPGFKIPQWQRNRDYTYQNGALYPRLSVVTPATHDHEPLAGLWRTLWKEYRDAQAAHDDHRAHVGWLELQRFVWWLGWDGHQIPDEFTAELHEAFCRQVLQSNSWLAIFMVTDVFAQELRFNVPGENRGSNWTARFELPVSEFDRHPDFCTKGQRFTRWIEESGRSSSAINKARSKP